MYDEASGILSYIPEEGLVTGAKHVIIIDAEDRVGNKAAKVIRVFRVKPREFGRLINIFIQGSLPNPVIRYVNTPTPEIFAGLTKEGMKEINLERIMLKVDGVVIPHIYVNGRLSPLGEMRLEEGTHTVVISGEDIRRNKFLASTKLVIDLVKPEVVNLEIREEKDKVVITGIIRDNYQVAEEKIVMKINGQKVTHSYEQDRGWVMCTLGSELTREVLEVEIEVEDIAGNKVMASKRLVLSNGITDLSQVIVYPNPTEGKEVVFDQVPSNIKLRIKVFNLAGEEVYDEQVWTGSSGRITWSCEDNRGRKVASGIYIYLISDEQGNKRKGKIGVMR